MGRDFRLVCVICAGWGLAQCVNNVKREGLALGVDEVRVQRTTAIRVVGTYCGLLFNVWDAPDLRPKWHETS